MTARRPVVVIGIGNPVRGDDAVGLEVVSRVAADLPPGAVAVALDGEPARLIEAWSGFDAAVLVDAVVSGDHPAGHVHRVQVTDASSLPSWGTGASSHAAGVAEAVALARALDRLPACLVVYGIEGVAFGEGEALSPLVAARLDTVVERVAAEIIELTRAGAVA
jgi:hydrogenase maturation protease